MLFEAVYGRSHRLSAESGVPGKSPRHVQRYAAACVDSF